MRAGYGMKRLRRGQAKSLQPDGTQEVRSLLTDLEKRSFGGRFVTGCSLLINHTGPLPTYQNIGYEGNGRVGGG